MEETELLRILSVTAAIVISKTCFACDGNNTCANQGVLSQENLSWVDEATGGAHVITSNSIKEIMNEPYFDQKIKEGILKPRPALQIFVSSSMPKAQLKAYALEAKRFGGVLVFKGLPGGSVSDLRKLVMEISTEESAAMQIDDEAFKVFEVERVPAIVLSETSSIFAEQSIGGKFDKVTGGVTIKVALELFHSNGNMTLEAKELLK
jgi:type-F conjugative transfer system pilin assembly protein TrbC